MHELAVIVVSTNEAHWIEPCLRTVFRHADGVDLDVVVADNDSTDGTDELVASRFPAARVVRCRNRGFGHANNRALTTCDARYVLFLNPDTEIVAGSLAELVRLMEERPGVGLAGCRQLLPDGVLFPTIRRFPSPLRAFGEALGSERLPVRASWLGERELDMSAYERETGCDWTSGSFMFARREALESAGFLDERFFMSSEETDLCARIKRTGWEIVHLPAMTIVHHEGKAGIRPRMEAQYAFARRQYAYKHFSTGRRRAYIAALATRHALRASLPGEVAGGSTRREASRRALRAVLGIGEPPFGPPPRTAVAARAGGTAVQPE